MASRIGPFYPNFALKIRRFRQISRIAAGSANSHIQCYTKTPDQQVWAILGPKNDPNLGAKYTHFLKSAQGSTSKSAKLRDNGLGTVMGGSPFLISWVKI